MSLSHRFPVKGTRTEPGQQITYLSTYCFIIECILVYLLFAQTNKAEKSDKILKFL